MVSLNSPDVNNYYIGKGIVSIKRDTDPDWVDIGNVSEFEFTPGVKNLDHFSSRAGVKVKDRSVVIEKTATLRMVMDEWTALNLSMILLGTPTTVSGLTTIDILSQDLFQCAVKLVGSNDVGPQWIYEFPVCQFAPTKSIQPIQTADAWGTLEATADVIFANNTFGSATSAFTQVDSPVVQAAPEIFGTAQVGHVLTAFPGTWLHNPTLTYQWKKAGSSIGGATGTTYTPVSGDIGSAITVTITATNTAGSASATSAGTANVIA